MSFNKITLIAVLISITLCGGDVAKGQTCVHAMEDALDLIPAGSISTFKSRLSKVAVLEEKIVAIMNVFHTQKNTPTCSKKADFEAFKLSEKNPNTAHKVDFIFALYQKGESYNRVKSSKNAKEMEKFVRQIYHDVAEARGKNSKKLSRVTKKGGKSASTGKQTGETAHHEEAHHEEAPAAEPEEGGEGGEEMIFF